ncbi:MAG: hypothetical protein MI784_09030 [Cytophagales bacterium]|nr:hypothetical protein [Cytophagales bacterium]
MASRIFIPSSVLFLGLGNIIEKGNGNIEEIARILSRKLNDQSQGLAEGKKKRSFKDRTSNNINPKMKILYETFYRKSVPKVFQNEQLPPILLI